MAKHLTNDDIEEVKKIVTEAIVANNKILLKEFKILKDDVVQFKDEILHEIINLRDDNAVLTGYRGMIEDHDVRIVKIEKHVFPDKAS